MACAEERVYFLAGNTAFFYREVFPLQLTPLPSTSDVMWSQEVVFGVKCAEFGVPGVFDARFAVQSRSEAS